MNGYFDQLLSCASILDLIMASNSQKSVKMPIFLPVDPVGPKDRDLDPSAKIG